MGYSLSPWAACVTLWAMCERPAANSIHEGFWLFGRYINDVILIAGEESGLESDDEVAEWLKTLYTAK